MLLLAIAVSWAHGVRFGAVSLSAAPGSPETLWVLTDGWGLARTTDGGGSWEWLCEEALGGADIYGVAALDAGTALVATRDGLLVVDGACGHAPVPGTEGRFAPAVARYGEGILALLIGPDEGAVRYCDPTGCATSSLAGPGLFPKSVAVDGDRAWVGVVHEDTLAAELWTSTDGAAWTRAHAWPDGDTDPRVLSAAADRVLLWRRTRSPEETPGLLRSRDAGASFDAVLETGSYTDAAPGLLVVGGALLLGTNTGARTWRSEDDGLTWSEVSVEVPAVRCGLTLGDVGYACADHLQDGIDLARTTDGRTWVPVACLEEALPAACAETTCAPLRDAYAAAGDHGGGACDTVIRPPEAASAVPPVCGCAGEGGGAAILLGVLLGRRGTARRGRAGERRAHSPPRTR